MWKVALFLVCLSAASVADSEQAHLQKLRSRYPFGLIGDDFGILTQEDLAINTCNALGVSPFSGAKNMAYPYWQCFSLKDTRIACNSLGYDAVTKKETGHMVIEARGGGGAHEYIARDAMNISACRKWLRIWEQKTRAEQYVCLSGPYGAHEEVKEGDKTTNWVFDKFKTQKGCESFFRDECSLRKQESDSCILPDDWIRGLHAPGVAEGPAYKGKPLVLGKSSIEGLILKYPKKEADKKIEGSINKILKDQGESIHLSAGARLEHYKNGKLKIPIWLRIPPPCSKDVCPVIVNVYGDGSCFSGGYEWRSEIFLQAGFIVAEPNIRGSSCPSQQWEEAAKGERKLEALTDIQACGRFLKARFKRKGREPTIGIVGWSYGGLVALTAMTRFAGTFDAGYALAVKTDLYSFFKSAPASLRVARQQEYGDPDRDYQRFKDLSPSTYVDQVEGPIALMLGGQDPKVSLSDADAFASELRSRGKDVSLMIVPEHGHLTEKPEEIMFEYAHILQFFSAKLSHGLSFQGRSVSN